MVTLAPHSVSRCGEHDSRDLTPRVVRPRDGAFVTQASDARVPGRRHGACPQADNLAIVECRGLEPVVVEKELDPLGGRSRCDPAKRSWAPDYPVFGRSHDSFQEWAATPKSIPQLCCPIPRDVDLALD